MTAYDLASLVPGLDQEAARLAALEAERAQGEAVWQAQRLQLAERTRQSLSKLREAMVALDPAAAAEEAAAVEQTRWQRRAEAVTAAAGKLRRQSRERIERRLAEQRTSELASARERMAQNAGQRSDVLRGLATQRLRAQTLVTEVHTQAKRAGIAMPPVEVAASSEVPLGTDAARALEGLVGQLDQLSAMLPRVVTGWQARVARPIGGILLPLLALLPPAGLAVALPGWAIAPWVVGLAVVLQIVVFGLRSQMRSA